MVVFIKNVLLSLFSYCAVVFNQVRVISRAPQNLGIFIYFLVGAGLVWLEDTFFQPGESKPVIARPEQKRALPGESLPVGASAEPLTADVLQCKGFFQAAAVAFNGARPNLNAFVLPIVEAHTKDPVAVQEAFIACSNIEKVSAFNACCCATIQSSEYTQFLQTLLGVISQGNVLKGFLRCSEATSCIKSLFLLAAKEKTLQEAVDLLLERARAIEPITFIKVKEKLAG